MKYFIVGLHGSGKHEVLNILESEGIKCGKIFSNLPKPSPLVYNSFNFEKYENQDINDIFENNAYFFIKELPLEGVINIQDYFEGLSMYSFENNDVFVMSPDQVLAIPPINIREDICWVWMDNNNSNRKNRYFSERRGYSFIERDKIESSDIQSFIKLIYNKDNNHIIYFNNEEPCRVATIIYSLIKHPELLKLYEKNFQ